MLGTTHPVAQFDIQEGLNPHYKSTGKRWLAKSSEDRGPTMKMIFCMCMHILSCICTHTHARSWTHKHTYTSWS